MNVEEYRDYCLSLGSDVEEKLPFVKFKNGEGVLVFYVCGHMFCFFDLNDFQVISLKCQPERIDELKAQYACVGNPYNESPKHWIGLDPRTTSDDLARDLIRNSYEIVKAKYSKKRKEDIDMARLIREARAEDITQLMPIFEAARQIMRQSGNVHQWINGYPSEEVVRNDIERHGGFVVIDDAYLQIVPTGKERIVAYFAFLPAPEPTYEKIYDGAWLNDEPYYVIHRLASWPDVHGVWDSVLGWAFERTNTLRVDTHRDNHIMQHNLEKHGFIYCGIIYLLSGDERLAYQKTIGAWKR